jgi:hypothetical protein
VLETKEYKTGRHVSAWDMSYEPKVIQFKRGLQFVLTDEDKQNCAFPDGTIKMQLKVWLYGPGGL